MKLSRATALLMMASLSVPAFAGAEQVAGKMASASQGTLVSRDGKLIAAYPGQSLYSGDRVVTRGKSTAKVAMPGCSFTMAPASMMAISKSSCATAPRAVAAQDEETAAGTTGTGTSASTVFVALAAAVAIGAGIYVAVEENDATPASP